MKQYTRKKLLPLLISHYENVISQLTEENWDKLIYASNVSRGICYASNILFDINLYNTKWVKEECVFTSPKWAAYPRSSDSLNECKELLQIRVDKMKKILASLTK